MYILPRDGNNVPLQISPIGEAIAVTYDATISSATDITLNAATTIIEVTAIDKGVFLKYGTTVTTSDFDEFIPQNVSKEYAIPNGVTIISVIQEAATGKVVVIEK